MGNRGEALHEIMKLRSEITQLRTESWLNYEVFTWNWWLLIVFLIVPWIIWIKFVDRNRIFEVLLFGMIAISITLYLDAVGDELLFWVYPITFIPVGTIALPFDVSMVGVAYMLVYQYFTTWKSYIIALVVMAGIYAFIGESFAHWAELVYYPKWTFYYSFIYYILKGLLVKCLMERMRKMSVATVEDN
ncbi:hypothetical protein LGQ02_03430 [Bacillus shivajii]|uniref:CBO0543 family protein n=1 Tax=Bacillus shivajii TaxID=1983719 RepID=UPI001CFC2009|nr:CBO0543 family protein [Bacillus shivajii]UCZ53849.1 hypothetical protein LGQ02_03430 [Bacillus shivajii]